MSQKLSDSQIKFLVGKAVDENWLYLGDHKRAYINTKAMDMYLKSVEGIKAAGGFIPDFTSKVEAWDKNQTRDTSIGVLEQATKFFKTLNVTTHEASSSKFPTRWIIVVIALAGLGIYFARKKKTTSKKK